jgi:hypothetical protein
MTHYDGRFISGKQPPLAHDGDTYENEFGEWYVYDDGIWRDKPDGPLVGHPALCLTLHPEEPGRLCIRGKGHARPREWEFDERLAEAWDEGHRVGTREPFSTSEFKPNPYREQS